MSDYRDSLSETARAIFDQVIPEAGQKLASWRSQAAHEGQPLTERAA